jgi:hypothetical protein
LRASAAPPVPRAGVINEFKKRQLKVPNRLFDGFVDRVTSSKREKITKCAKDTANRYIVVLMALNLLKRRERGAGAARIARWLSEAQPAITTVRTGGLVKR